MKKSYVWVIAGSLIVTILTVFAVRLSRHKPEDDWPRLIKIRATIRDNNGKPIQGAHLDVTDVHRNIVEDSDMVLWHTGTTGKASTHVPISPQAYFVSADADGYVSAKPVKVSGSINSNVVLVTFKKAKHQDNRRQIRKQAVP